MVVTIAVRDLGAGRRTRRQGYRKSRPTPASRLDLRLVSVYAPVVSFIAFVISGTRPVERASRRIRMRFRTVSLCLLLLGSAVLPASAADKDSRLYEMRTYYSPPGKLDALHARFRDHTMKLFEKHGMTNIGYWVPIDNPDNKLIYILAFPSKEEREKAWKAFQADEDWKKVRKETEANGPIVSKVEVQFLTATDYSPAIK